MSTPVRRSDSPTGRVSDDDVIDAAATDSALRRVESAFDSLSTSSGDLSRRSARASDRVNAALDRLAESERRRRNTR